MTLLLLLILAHIIGDFILQTDAISKSKCKREWFGFIIHFLTILVCNFFATIPYNLYTAVKFSLLISTIHILFDFIKVSVKTEKWWDSLRLSKIFRYNWLSLIGLTFDQIFHLATIYLLWKYSFFSVYQGFSNFLSSVVAYFNIPVNKMAEIILNDRSLLILIAYTGITFGGAVYTRKFLDCLYPEMSEENSRVQEEKDEGEKDEIKSAKKMGKYIGIFERFIIVTLILNKALPAVAFVMTAKSIARYKLLEKEEFAEYFLIGTMFSVAIAITGAIFTQFILSLV